MLPLDIRHDIGSGNTIELQNVYFLPVSRCISDTVLIAALMAFNEYDSIVNAKLRTFHKSFHKSFDFPNFH